LSSLGVDAPLAVSESNGCRILFVKPARFVEIEAADADASRHRFSFGITSVRRAWEIAQANKLRRFAVALIRIDKTIPFSNLFA
jgi:hypothetical protein